MNAGKILQAIIIVLVVVIIAGVPAYYFAGTLLMAESFTGEIVKTQRAGQTYFVIPEATLEGAVLVDNEGTRYYVLSEEKLRLLGPKLLGGSDGFHPDDPNRR